MERLFIIFTPAITTFLVSTFLNEKSGKSDMINDRGHTCDVELNENRTVVVWTSQTNGQTRKRNYYSVRMVYEREHCGGV